MFECISSKTRPLPTLGPRSSRVLVVGLAMMLLVAATACLGLSGSTDQVELVSSTTVNGWHYDFYRNRAYPCSVSGYQTFAIGTKVGSTDTETKPLWVKMRGGGYGYFDATGTAQPSAGLMKEMSLDDLLQFDTPGLMATVKSAPEGFRTMLVSMCSHDLYGGMDTPDPNNPNLTPEGDPRLTNGLISTKAAIQYTQAHYPTDDYFLNGTSAGSAGTFHVAWALQRQGIPPTGIVADSGVINQAWEQAVVGQGTCGDTDIGAGVGLLARIDPEVGAVGNQPHLLVSTGELTVPVMHVWNHGDHNSCGVTPMACPLPDGSTVTLGAADCRHEPLREAILAEGPGSRSADLKVCVEGGDTTQPCDLHVVTTRAHGVNSDPGAPADYNAAIMTWVQARLADD